MFTGLIQERGVVTRARMRDGLLALTIEAPSVAAELRPGESVAVNGVCLTAVRASRRRFAVEVIEETLARTTLGALARKSYVNLELPLRLGDRLGGHLVQGHVDAVADVTSLEDVGESRRVRFRAGRQLVRYLVPKGSVTVDGVSLTVVDVTDGAFDVALIPRTQAVTTMGALTVGSRVNVEADLLAKYVEQMVSDRRPGAATEITRALGREGGG